VGRQTAIAETGLALVAPSAGVGALWLLRSTRRGLALDSALIVAASLLVSWMVDIPVAAALVLAPGNLAIGLVVRRMLRPESSPGLEVHDGKLPSMHSTHSLILLGAASLVAAVASAPFGVLGGLVITGHATWLSAGALVIRNATSIFTLACAVLALVTAQRRKEPGDTWSCCLTQEDRPHVVADFALSFAISGVVLGLVFGTQLHVPLAFVPLAVSAFVGFRFAPAIASSQTLLTSVVAVVATLTQHGPFGVVDDALVAAMVVQGFVLIQTAIAVTLSFAVADRVSATAALRTAQRDANERAQLLDSVTHSLSHGLAVVDGDGRVLVKNAAARRIIAGDEPRLDLAKSPADYGLRHVDGSELSTAEMPHVIAFLSGRPAELEMLLEPPGMSGLPAVMHVRAEPLELRGPGARRVAVVTFDDVTQQRSQVQQLESFAGVVAHDLQNPLAAVTSWTEVLTDHLTDLGAMDDFSAQTLERISRSGQSMSDLIADLLAYASASSAALDLQPVDLDLLVGTLATELRAANPHAPIITIQPLGLITADPVLMRQLFTNVLGNAVKYVPGGTRPRVRVTSRRDDAQLEIRIADNGIGIPPESRESVFQGFVRAHGSAAYAGTGLGLAICARAVERHGGSIAALEGANGAGTTIRIQLPVRVLGSAGPASQESVRG
jgi:signal transduction histidine kinase